MKVTLLDKDLACPCCGKGVNAASSLSQDRKPRPGDITVCVYCQTPLWFNDKMQYDIVTDAEFAQLPEELQVTIGAVRRAARELFRG